jgi:hypothetical protein
MSDIASDWGSITILATIIFAATLFAARLFVRSRRRTLRIESELPVILGIGAGLALTLAAFGGSSQVTRILLPVATIVAGFVLAVLPQERPFRWLSTRWLGIAIVTLGALSLVVWFISPR